MGSNRPTGCPSWAPVTTTPDLFSFAQPVGNQREALELVSCRVKNKALRCVCLPVGPVGPFLRRLLPHV